MPDSKPTEICYRHARTNLARLLDRVTQDREIIVIDRPGQEGVAMIPSSELSSLAEMAYLFRSPANARHLLEAVSESLADRGLPTSPDQLRREFGLERPS